MKSLDQVKRKEEREIRPTPYEQPHFIPIGDEHSCHHPADEAQPRRLPTTRAPLDDKMTGKPSHASYPFT